MNSLHELAERLELAPSELLPWGPDRAKISLEATRRPPRGRLVLVTAMSPSPAGEGKTTVSIGLSDALNRLGHGSTVALRQPSLGPVFGSKGGATGGGLSGLHPEESINLHFTGDFHAVTAAHNLLSAALDAHLHHGNALGIDPRRPGWRRAVDMNDRALRRVLVGLGGPDGGVPREDGYDITAASEIMAILGLSRDLADLRRRLGRILVGTTPGGEAVRADDLGCAGAMTVLLREALLPNLVQSREGNPALVHTGPFANLAHGTSSVTATLAGLQGSDFVVQEAGFGADLGGEKFIDLFCPAAGVTPACAVVVITAKGCKYHGGHAPATLFEDDPEALELGVENALAQLQLIRALGMTALGALNEFSGDRPEELARVQALIEQAGFPVFRVRPYQEGGAGLLDLAEAVSEARPGTIRPLQTPDMSLEEKLESVARGAYGASGVELSRGASRSLAQARRHGLEGAGICVARTPYSFTHDPSRRGRPTEFQLQVREIRLLAGAGFVVPVCGDLMTMPGLGSAPNLQRIDLDEQGRIRWG